MREYIFLIICLLSMSVCAQQTTLPSGQNMTGSIGSASVSYGQVHYITMPEVQTGVQQWYLLSYTLTAASNDNSHGIVNDASGTYLEGTSVTLTAIPAVGYRLVQWSDGVTDNPRSVTIASDTAITAIFAIKRFVVNGDSCNYGAMLTLTAPDSACYAFTGWSNGATGNPYHLVVSRDSTVTPLYAIRRYRVGWKNGADILAADSVNCGDTPAYSGATPQKDATAQYTYTFSGWSPAIGEAHRDTVYTALFDSTVNRYTLNGDSCDYGATVTLTASAPDCQHFVQWSNGVTTPTQTITVTSDSTVTAQYAINRYQITWKNGTAVLAADSVNCGDTPAYSGATPEKDATAEFTFTFSGWSPAIGEAHCDTVYTAEFTSTVNEYAVTFKNYDGTVLQQGDVAYGRTPSYTGATPEKPATQQYTYTFKTWGPAVAAVTGVAEYVAQFDSTVNRYTLNGDSCNYGATVTLTASAPDCQHFVQWSNGETTQTITVTVTSDSTVTALYETTQYLVSFQNADGTTLQADSADCGSMPAYTGATPARDATLQYTYTFKGWLPALEEVSADAVYTAEYDSVAVVYLLDVSVLHGSYTLSPEGEYHYGDTVSITVQPDEGYKWSSWADGVTDNPRAVVLLSDTALSAECVDIKSALLPEEADRVGAVKFIRDGKIFILTPEGRIYDSTGKRVE